MTIKVKICGLSEAATLQAAVDARADYVGFVFFPRSPRNVSIEQAAQLVAKIDGAAKSVALCVNAEDDLISQINKDVQPDMFQLHGSESPERVAEVKSLTGKPVIKALGIASEEDVLSASSYKDVADIILFDAKPPKDGKSLPGGNGLSFDWTLLKKVENDFNSMLSGGLNPDNVQTAIKLTGASAVDVSSGVEAAPGVKSSDLIHQFIANARSSQH